MTPRQTTSSVPQGGVATLTLPESLTLESMSRQEHDLGCMLRNALPGPATGDPGAIEFDSWLVQLH